MQEQHIFGADTETLAVGKLDGEFLFVQIGDKGGLLLVDDEAAAGGHGFAHAPIVECGRKAGQLKTPQGDHLAGLDRIEEAGELRDGLSEGHEDR